MTSSRGERSNTCAPPDKLPIDRHSLALSFASSGRQRSAPLAMIILRAPIKRSRRMSNREAREELNPSVFFLLLSLFALPGRRNLRSFERKLARLAGRCLSRQRCLPAQLPGRCPCQLHECSQWARAAARRKESERSATGNTSYRLAFCANRPAVCRCVSTRSAPHAKPMAEPMADRAEIGSHVCARKRSPGANLMPAQRQALAH